MRANPAMVRSESSVASYCLANKTQALWLSSGGPWWLGGTPALPPIALQPVLLGPCEFDPLLYLGVLCSFLLGISCATSWYIALLPPYNQVNPDCCFNSARILYSNSMIVPLCYCFYIYVIYLMSSDSLCLVGKSLFFIVHSVVYHVSQGSYLWVPQLTTFFWIYKRDAFILLHTFLLGDDRNCEVGSSVVE